MALSKQLAAQQSTALMTRMNAAIVRHAVFLVTKPSPTPGEVLWRDKILGSGYASYCARAARFVCALPVVYNAATPEAVTDVELLSIVPDLPAQLPPLANE
ncbi:MAG TPA: hypothetical protein VE869_18405 [Gemmatimonas sp.]|nr:hypothetical protein [Gemmatimonas sp.]